MQQRAVDTRERLVDAALRSFAAHGFDGATTRDIARDAGVALAALPYHFETKEALWQAAADRIFGRLRDHFGVRLRGLEGVDLRTRLRLLLGDFVRFAARHPELHRFMLQEGTGPSSRRAWLVEKHVRPLFDLLRALISQGQEHGVVSAGKPEHLCYAMIGAASMPYAVGPEFELLTGDDAFARPLVEAHVDALLRLFFPEPEQEGSRAARRAKRA